MDDDEAETIAGKNTRTSSIWQHFDVLSEKDRNAECKQCREPFSFRTTITNLRRHLERKHNNDMINKQSDDEQDQMEEVYLDEEGLAEVSTDKRKILRNGAWEYFEVIDEAQRTARCRLCNEDFSYRTTSTNLNKHLMRKHFMTMKVSDDETGQEGEKGSTERSRSNKNSISWEYFSITDPIKRIATCKLCNTECSYWSSVSNLMKHVRRKHANATYPDDDDESDERDEKPPDVVNATDRGRSNQNSISWEYFTITDPVKRIATCKLCDCDRSYWGSVSNLMKHVRRRHGVGTNTEKYDSDDKVDTNNSKARSSIWLYFKCINKKSGKSMCLICKKKLSHRSSITNLKRHLQRKHPQIELGDGNADSKKMLLSSDGQLYEIDENTNEDAHDTEDDTDQNAVPMEIYLDEIEGNVLEKSQDSKANTVKKSLKNAKRIVIDDSNDSCSSNNEFTVKKQYKRTKTDSLDQFGKYIVSLLRQLPSSVSNQLQADFVKQIMSCQRYEPEGVVVNDANRYAITITDSQPVVAVPVDGDNDSVFVQAALQENSLVN